MTLFAPNRWFRRNFLLLGLMVMVLSGCAPPYTPPYQPPSTHEAIGILEAAGPNVFYNNQRIVGGGHTIFSGDNVSTGADSRATVRLTGGGVVTLDENTDPDFIQETWCILVKIFKGQVHTDGPGICFETPHASGVVNSEVNIRVTYQDTTITVLRGSVDLHRPVALRINASEEVRITRARVQQVRTLSHRELGEVFRWIRRVPDQDRASDSRRCRSYAKAAVTQQQENQERRCGFTGVRWLADFNAHYQWCMQVPQSAAESENRARLQALKTQCSVAGSQDEDRQRCQQYARTAITQQKENIRRRCGFGGNRWSGNYSLHYQWCMQVPQKNADAETRARSVELRKCSYPKQIIK